MIEFEDLPDNVADFFRAHVKLYLTDPARAHLWDATPIGWPGQLPTLLLTTRGRKTGKQRHAPVVYTENSGIYLVAGSRGGTSVDPAWYGNLLDDPDCEIRVSTLHVRARARILEGEERDRAWKTITDAQPLFLKYQARTTRKIPVMELRPVGERIA